MIMSAEYERQLLARARQLADLSDLTDAALACLGGARHAGLDPEAITGLVGCAAALSATSTDTYCAGDGWAGRHPDERAFLAHIASIEDDIDERLAAAARLGQEVSAARDTARADLDGARRQLAAARAMPLLEDCDGCHGRRDAAIDEAQDLIRDCETRISICETAGRILQVLRARLIRARARIRAVPADLGETYESVYRLIRAGGHLPYEGRFITGETVTR
jgi:multidrug efflux pump subunit AcrA (membrane-fusion protein)